jgi:hypothetical protein
MGYTLCVLGVRARTPHVSIADPDSDLRMRNNGHSDNIRRARQPAPAEPPARPEFRPAQVGVPHSGNLHPHPRGRRPQATLTLHRLRTT